MPFVLMRTLAFLIEPAAMVLIPCGLRVCGIFARWRGVAATLGERRRWMTSFGLVPRLYCHAISAPLEDLVIDGEDSSLVFKGVVRAKEAHIFPSPCHTWPCAVGRCVSLAFGSSILLQGAVLVQKHAPRRSMTLWRPESLIQML